MSVAKCFIFASLVLSVKIYFVFSEDCTAVTTVSGTLTNKKTAHFYSKCWSFTVPEGHKVEIGMESFKTRRGNYYEPDCALSKVEISLNNGKEKHIYCPDLAKDPLILQDEFTVTHYMSSSYFTIQSEFSLEYRYENLPCSEGTDIECDENNVCIIKSLGCDATEECSDGMDGKQCSSRTSLVLGLTENRVSGIKWLMNKWSYTTGWQENTHRGITALFLASERNEKKVNAEEKLMVKQLEVQALVYISRKETDEITVNQLSMLVNALIMSCLNPHNFYGHDLVKLLKDEVEVSSTITHSVAYLALCNAGATLPINTTINDLGNLLKTNAEESFLLDVQAVAIMALSCLKANEQKALNASFPQTDYDEAVKKFKELQLEDGSFGNVYTTAIVTQALISAGEENSKDWSYNKAINVLTQHLKSPSADFLSVYLILPILNGKCLSHIGNTNCSKVIQRDSVDDVKSKMGLKMRVQYTLNIGDEKDIVHTISLRVTENITVFEVMQLAQDADTKYKFQKRYMGEKLYIYGIAGIINDFEDDKFWLLYVGKNTKSMKYTNESPDKITLQDGDHIVMWYKKAHI